MRASRVALTALALAALASTTGCVIANRFYRPADQKPAPVEGGAPDRRAGERLELMTWNIGYAGMGREADFIADGGRQRRPTSADLVEENLEAIERTLRDSPVDLHLLQEVARPSWNTYQTDVLRRLEQVLPGHARVFGPDLLTRGVPRPFRISVGKATFSAVEIERAAWLGLPLEPGFYAGLFRTGYRMLVVWLTPRAGGPSWVIVNIHLAAFDQQAAVRRAQVREVLAFAAGEHEKGHHVVVGGDWNLRLADTEFPHRTEEKHLFWVHDFPEELGVEGWRWAVDPDRPTVRTAHQPYREAENYVTIIDGFLCSPNVRIESVETLDLGFAHTDHHPVRLRVGAGEEGEAGSGDERGGHADDRGQQDQ